MNHDVKGGKGELCRLEEFVLMGTDVKSGIIQPVIHRDKQIWLFQFRICVEMYAASIYKVARRTNNPAL